MLRSLPEESPVLKHISKVAEQCESSMEVTGSVKQGSLSPFSATEFPNSNIPINEVPKKAGAYVFTEKEVATDNTKPRQAVGSAVEFRRRLN